MSLTDVTVTVDGVARGFRPTSLQVPDMLGERRTCRFVLVTDPGVHFTKGMPVEVEEGAAVLFAGLIDRVAEVEITPDGHLAHTVACVGWATRADRRLAAVSYENQMAGDMVADLITTYLAAEGITAGTIDDGPTVTAAVFPYLPVSAALDRIAAAATFSWWIDDAKALHFRDRSSVAAPWEIGDGDVLAHSARVEHAARDYRNREYVTGTDITDPQTESFTGDGETRTWLVSFPVDQVPTVTVNSVAQTVGIRGVEEGKQFYWSRGDSSISQDSSETALTGSDTLAVTYRGQFPVLTLSEDPTAIADLADVEGSGSGMVEHLAQADASITSRTAALEAGRAALAEYARMGRTLTFTTQRSGLEAGQQATVNLPQHGLDGVSMLVRSVELSSSAGLLAWDVTCIEGAVDTTWAQFLAARRPAAVDLTNVGSGPLILLTLTTEEGGWSEAVAESVYACHTPSTTLYPAEDLLPC